MDSRENIKNIHIIEVQIKFLFFRTYYVTNIGSVSLKSM
jgi:hypothetical protein